MAFEYNGFVQRCGMNFRHLAVALLLLVASGCATPGIDTVSSSSGGLPSIAVQAPVGLPPAMTARLGDQLITALQRRSVSMASRPDSPAQFKLQGFCSAADSGNSTAIACVWDANGQDGARAQRIVTEETVSGSSPANPWSVVNDATLDRIAESVGEKIAAWVPKASSGTSGGGGFNLPTLQGLGLSGRSSQSIALVGVSGAPGDGNQALSRAIATALRSRDIAVTSVNARSYRLTGTVAMADAGSGEQSVTIEWALADPGGASLGAVTQRNRIPRGALDGPWGPTADTSATAAAKGIVDLLPGRS
jgi:hypothetical protein